MGVESDLKHSVEVCRDGHLLVQLGALREAGGRAEVVCSEDSSTALRLAADELGRLDLHETVAQQRLAEIRGDA